MCICCIFQCFFFQMLVIVYAAHIRQQLAGAQLWTGFKSPAWTVKIYTATPLIWNLPSVLTVKTRDVSIKDLTLGCIMCIGLAHLDCSSVSSEPRWRKQVCWFVYQSSPSDEFRHLTLIWFASVYSHFLIRTWIKVNRLADSTAPYY